MIDPHPLLEPLRELHDMIRDAVVIAAQRQDPGALSLVERDAEGDTVYKVDAISEAVLIPFFERLSREHSFVLIAEGLPGGQLVYPKGAGESTAAWRIIMDPIDGTRGIMYEKRSAWILTGVAPNRGSATGLQDIVLAIQTEIPVVKQHLSDQVWAVKDQYVKAIRHNRLTGKAAPLRLRPSRAQTIAHGFAMIARFFPGGRRELAEIDDEIVTAALGSAQPGKALCFEDQYISTGGQLFELMAGHDRFVADLRPLIPMKPMNSLLCCHPYDLSCALIATELGIIVTDGLGHSLNAPLDTHTNVAWIGYANEDIRQQIEPLLQASLRKRGWI
ncbi:MAG TPA: inositol monophosphatase [Terriglobia bacterium]|nr:inositol monophosphatase [Terriglobia bacterium]